jgi:Uma2 family endonuclease
MSLKPKPLHQQVCENIKCLLDSASERTDYVVNGNSNIKFMASNSAPSPDVFVVETSRWKEAIKEDTYIDEPPLMVVEVLSPSEDVSEKIVIYLDAGVGSLWIVDLQKRVVLVCGGSERRQYGEHAEINLPFPLNDSIGLDDIFSGLPESVFSND